MNLRNKLVLSNILMVLIPIAIALVLCSLVALVGGQYYFDALSQMFEDDKGLYTAQGIVYESRGEIQEYLKELEEDENDSDKDDKDDWNEWYEDAEEELQKLTAGLTAIGYHYQMICNDQVVLTNLDAKDEETIQKLVGSDYQNLATISLSDEEASITKNTFHQGDYQMEVLAIHAGGASGVTKNNTLVYQYFTRLAVLFGAIVILSIVGTNAILSRWMAKTVLVPLTKLREGASKVQKGELSYRIPPQKGNEMGTVCEEFNNMASYLEDSVKERVQYEEYRKELIAGISHDLRTPLTSIKGYVEGLMDGIANTPEKQKRYYEAIHIRTGDIEKLISNLADLSELEHQRFSFHFEKMDLAAYLMKYLDENREDFCKHSVRIETDFPETGVWIKGDFKEWNRVMQNLIYNAIKYRQKDKSLVKLAIKLEADHIKLRIQDDGPGVAEKDLRYLFKSFYRGDAARSNPGQGNGLGLSIVKSIIEGHHGTIAAGNQNGLLLTISLPYWDSDETETGRVD